MLKANLSFPNRRVMQYHQIKHEKGNRLSNRLLFKHVWLLLIFMFLFVSACTPSATPIAPIATSTLIPVTATITPQPLIPTPTSANLFDPDTIQLTPTLVPPLPILPTEPIDFTLVDQVTNDFSQQRNIPLSGIRLAYYRTESILSATFSCQPTTLLTDIVTRTEQFRNRENIRIGLLVGTVVYEYHVSIGADDTQIFLCETPQVVRGELLMAVDGVAQEMAQLARRRLAQELDLPTVRIMIDDIVPMTWTDTSLGCPLPDQTYEPASIVGFRIVVSTTTQTTVYHTDAVSLFECALDSETSP